MSANPKDLLYKDCLRDCLRILLNVPDDDMPPFDQEDLKAYWLAVQEWLGATYDLWLMDVPFLYLDEADKEPTFPWFAPLSVVSLFILVGQTSNGVCHAVIGQLVENNLYVFYDPMVKAIGVAATMTKFERAMFLVRRNSAQDVKGWHKELVKADAAEVPGRKDWMMIDPLPR
jgi:hypothetical protein